MVSLYSAPDAGLLRESLGTVWSCQYQGDTGMRVVDVKSLQSVVAIVPFPGHSILNGPAFFVEKMGLEVGCLGGIAENIGEPEE